MDWLKTLSPFIGVVTGWGLAELSKFRASRKVDRQKINKLIFFFLEIRFQFSREISLEKRLSQLFNHINEKLGDKLKEHDYSINLLYPSIRSMFQEQFSDSEKLDYLNTNIDEAILELSEIMPTLAYDLSEQHNIKERLSFMSRYLSEYETELAQTPFNWDDWIQGKFNDSIVDELGDSLIYLAKMSSKKLSEDVKERLVDQDQEMTVSPEFEKYLEQYFQKIQKGIEKDPTINFE
ncbi:MAG: hypothetical protein KI790_14770 [Cyclobacteriaceae bacterium]|nr:hypothetical protein [Cyclobacteriaceae bacterium HetDA_MAG_MS6]